MPTEFFGKKRLGWGMLVGPIKGLFVPWEAAGGNHARKVRKGSTVTDREEFDGICQGTSLYFLSAVDYCKYTINVCCRHRGAHM
jgi:hypothetical protein